MNIIQGFIKIPEISNNTPGVTAPFGELSPIAMTFSRNLKNYALPALYPSVEFVSFRSVDIASNNIEIPDALAKVCISVGDWTYNQSIDKAIPVNGQKTAFEQAITSEYNAVINTYGLPTPLLLVSVGEILDTPVAGSRMPDYITFKMVDDTKEYTVKLWFNDEKFQLQYLYFDMVVIPPVGYVDSLNNTTANVSTLLNGITKTQVINQINAITTINPATTVYPITLRWHNPVNTTSTLETEWFAVIYGKAGIDNDAVKDAIRTHIAENSGIFNWTSIYPDLYAESEFVIVPFWDQLSTPDNGYDEGLYRTGVTKSNLERIELQKLPSSYNTVTDYTAYKKLYLVSAASSYRSLMFYALGNPNNSGGYFSFLQLFPDYMDISTSSPDFSRLTVKTQGFVVKMVDALHKAREYTQAKPVPVGYSMSIKSNREYLGFDYEGFTFYIQTRTGYMKNN